MVANIRILPSTILGFPFVVEGIRNGEQYSAMGHRDTRALAIEGGEAHVKRIGGTVGSIEIKPRLCSMAS